MYFFLIQGMLQDIQPNWWWYGSGFSRLDEVDVELVLKLLNTI